MNYMMSGFAVDIHGSDARSLHKTSRAHASVRPCYQTSSSFVTTHAFVDTELSIHAGYGISDVQSHSCHSLESMLVNECSSAFSHVHIVHTPIGVSSPNLLNSPVKLKADPTLAAPSTSLSLTITCGKTSIYTHTHIYIHTHIHKHTHALFTEVILRL